MVAEIYGQTDIRTLLKTRGHRMCGLSKHLCTFSSEPAIDIVERHYAKNLKLDTFGELFTYNSGYLGKMFKNHTGNLFHTYLTKYPQCQSFARERA